ncbi:zinc finger CW-type PWWP domain protein 1 isoform X1 [Pogona vitticeps]
MPQRTFAPPVAKPNHAPFAKGKLEAPQSRQEDGVATKPIKIPPKKSNQKQEMNTSSTATPLKCRKDGVMGKERENYLTDAQYDEIFRSVLQKPLQECMEISGMKGVSVEANKEQILGRETLTASPTSKDDVYGKISKENSERMPLEAKKKEHPLGMKKYGKCFQHNNKGKEKNEKPEADNGGCKENRKGAPKKKVKGNTQVVIDQEEMQEEEKSDRGSGWCIAWVQCSSPTCKKWRQLPSDIDPSVLPEDWSCSQNTDLQCSSCSVPEETWSGSENEVVYAGYIPGSIVWAKQYGYPWWPGLIEADPDIEEYFLFSSQMDSLPSKYHVTFFGSSVTRAWISASSLRNFSEANVKENGLAKLKNKADKRDLETALKMAKEAEQISIQERIRRFGFFSRFNRRESPKRLKDHVNISCQPPAKRAWGGPESENKNTARSNKNQEKLLPAVPLTKPDGNVKKINKKGDKKSKLEMTDTVSLSKKSRRVTPPYKAVTVEQRSGKARGHLNGQKGLKKSFSVPRRKNAQTKQLSPCLDSSTAPMALSSYPNNNDCWNKVKTSPVAGSKGTVDLKESSEAMAFDMEEEETFSSQDLSVFAVEKNDSPEEFSLVLFEE